MSKHISFLMYAVPMSSAESTRLAFGDVVQFGDTNPVSQETTWYAPNVIKHGSEPNSVEAFPVAYDDEGNAFLDMPGTTWGTDVRVFGRLSLAEVRIIFLPHADPSHRPIFLRAHTGEDRVAEPSLEYNFRLHDCRGSEATE